MAIMQAVFHKVFWVAVVVGFTLAVQILRRLDK